MRYFMLKMNKFFVISRLLANLIAFHLR